MSDMLHSLYDLEVKVTNRNSILDIVDAIVQLPDQGRGLRLCIPLVISITRQHSWAEHYANRAIPYSKLWQTLDVK